MKTLELNIGLHSKTQGAINPCKVLNALTGRGFVLLQYRTAQSTCEDGAELCLAVRVGIPHDRSLSNAYASLYQLAIDYGQDCIAFAGFVGPKPYAGIDGALWISPDAPPALSDCQAMQAKHAAKAAEIDGFTKSRFVEYLTETLIPDLKESGFEATAEDFETACKFLARDEIEEHAHKVIASLPAPYQDALYQASAAQYHARTSGQGKSFEIRP